jgi:hypothetical protein
MFNIAGDAITTREPLRDYFQKESRSARFAVCLCFGGAILSASGIASMTGTSGPSFGHSGSLVRT